MKQPEAMDSVYHITSVDGLDAGNNGLLAVQPNQPTPGWHMASSVVDARRPADIIDMGIARIGSVYAHPTLEALRYDSMGAFQMGKAVALEVAVDPQAVLVADLKLYDNLAYEMFSSRHPHSTVIPVRLGKLITDYWNSTVTLADFRQHYTKDDAKKFGIRHALNEGAPAGLPQLIHRPEVLIPGSVGAERVNWVATIVPDPKTAPRTINGLEY